MGLLKSVGKGLMNKKLSVAMGGYFAYDTYNESRKEGNGVVNSALAAAGDMALGALLSPVGYAAYQAVTALPEAAVGGYMFYDKMKSSISRAANGQAFSNSVFNDTQQGFTMRQTGNAIAKRAQYNRQQAAMGNEAKYMYK